MRIEPYTVGSFLHVYNRGNRKQPIGRDDSDFWYFVQAFYYFNTKHTPENPFQMVRDNLKADFKVTLRWPETWRLREPIVKILAYNVLENHIHLVLKEIIEGGITCFMRRVGTGSANRFNKKYEEVGRLFQGPYKGRRVETDNQLKYLLVYVMVKNSFEKYPSGIKGAMKNFDKAYDWAAKNPLCSLGDYANVRKSPIIEKDMAKEFFKNHWEFKKFARECMENLNLDEKINVLKLD